MNETQKTIEDFGEQWQTFRSNPGFYGAVALLSDIMGPLLPAEDLRGARVAEIGSGTGRIVNMLLDAGASHVWAVEPSAAMDILQANTAGRSGKITCLPIPGEQLPADLGLEYVFSIGVIHHIPDPRPVLHAAYRALRPGGKLLIWVYGREGNETYLSFAEPMRKMTKRLPHFALLALTAVLYVFLELYIFLCRFLPLPMHVYMRNVLARFPHVTRYMTIYDQLNPAYAKYYREAEARALVADAGFQDVRLYHRHDYSWSVIGTKPENPKAGQSGR
ncbi:methyltransferase domain-containing protein [Candidatus Kaiserbacteria bacterium]|nr:methyltransferase domain-containing protein [Candidatus Kaiserbacteria bacterium]